MRSIEWTDGDIVIIDQTALPGRVVRARFTSTEQLADAIQKLRVRGAPAIGIAGALGVAQAAARGGLDEAERAAATLKATRPTAVNLGWAIDRVMGVGRETAAYATQREIAERMLEEALSIQAEDEHACLSIAKHAIEFFEHGSTVLTHCNTGFLCTGGYGTALGAIRYAHESGLGINVLATETRPLLQGARLTAWELGSIGIDHALVVDGAAPGLIARGEVSLVIVGADRIAANGDFANKVGTYPLALAAREAGIPFVVAAPTSSVDLSTKDGSAIVVAERAPEEVTAVLGTKTAPSGTRARNPAFDVTPARYVTAIVTENGIARAPFKTSLRKIAR
ncbi:MAG: S-methyl-5-thioribose-1-phosphate isomerase [Actinomycetota bacterium]